MTCFVPPWSCWGRLRLIMISCIIKHASIFIIIDDRHSALALVGQDVEVIIAHVRLATRQWGRPSCLQAMLPSLIWKPFPGLACLPFPKSLCRPVQAAQQCSAQAPHALQLLIAAF